jgi:hypothetical protein
VVVVVVVVVTYLSGLFGCLSLVVVVEQPEVVFCFASVLFLKIYYYYS